MIGSVMLADATGAITGLTYTASDEYGTPLDLNTGGVSANAPPRYGWLGGAQRSGDTLGGTILMRSRVYTPAIGRFLSIDPTPGGNANSYDYCTADPINCTDLTGNWPDWGAVLNIVAVVAEVVATIIPGPIGTAAGFISAGAYLATGNTSKATEMAITATAQLVGAGLAAKAAVKCLGPAMKAGRALTSGVSQVSRSALQAFSRGGQSLKNVVAVRIFKSRLIGVESPLLGHSFARGTPGILNRAGSRVKVGWSSSSMYGGGWHFRLGVGRNIQKPNQAKWHASPRWPFVANECS